MGQWDDLPEIDRVLAAARNKDFHNNRDTQKATLRYCADIVMRNGGMLPSHEKYRVILSTTINTLHSDKLMRPYANRITHSVWGVQKDIRRILNKAKKADANETARVHHIPVVFLMSALLVYKILGFTSSKEGEMNEMVTQQAGFLTTALFDYNHDQRPDIYTCDGPYTRDQSGPVSWAEASASARTDPEAAEAFFSVNLNLSTESAEQQVLDHEEIASVEVHAAMRAARNTPGWSCNLDTLELITRMFSARVSGMNMAARAAWKQRIDNAVTQLQIQPDAFWNNLDPNAEMVNDQGEVLTSLFTTNMDFINARSSMLRICRRPQSTEQERRDSVTQFNQQALPVLEVLRVNMQEWRTLREYVIRQLRAPLVDLLDQIEQWLALIHPPAQIESMFP